MKLDVIGRWRSDERRRNAWKQMVETDEFRSGLTAAVHQLQEELCQRKGGAKMLSGVNQLANRLCDMHELPAAQKSVRYSLPNPEAGT